MEHNPTHGHEANANADAQVPAHAHQHTTVTVTFPDGSTKEFPHGTSGLDIARSIGQRLMDAALACKIDGALKDINHPINDSCTFEVITLKMPEGLEVLRHSSAHLLAQAVLRLYPDAKPTIGPVVEEGFYYDIDMQPVTPEMQLKIEEEMAKIVKEDLPIHREEIPKREALKLFADNPFKVEMIQEMEEGTISIYRQGEFVDLCRGPHVPSTGKIKAVKIMKIAGAYWRANSDNKQLQRIYGISFGEKKELDAYLKQMEEAEKRDHRKIGTELDLYTLSDDIGPGLVLWLPKGNIIKEALEQWAKETEEAWGYVRVTTPLITKEGLFHTSEHLPHYSESMFPPMRFDNENYYIKPMNCPFHHMIFKARPRSYRELPLRVAEYGWCHRFEQSGALMGMMRVRGMQMNDAHIYCSKEDAVKEFLDVIRLHEYYYKILGITDYHMVLSLRDPKSDKYHGDEEMWLEAERLMREAMEQSGVKYQVDIGGAAFYGPKIDFQIKSVTGREFTASTNQIDLFMPRKFGLKFAGEDGKDHTPVCIHRAPLGTHERFIGFLIEHFAGKFPLWLNPVQVKIVTISNRHDDYALQVAKTLRSSGVRVEVDDRSETIGRKIREAQLSQINYILVIGDKEAESKTVNVRTRDNVVHGAQNVETFLSKILEEIKTKA